LRALLTAFLSLCLWGQSAGDVVAAQIEMVDGVVPGQKMILIRGEIVAGDDTRFYELAQQADRAGVFLESPGGSVEVGLSIGSEIALRGFTTLVLDGPGCHSICAVIWVSGARRYMSPDASISVHAAYELVNREDGTTDAPASGVGNATIGAYLNELGLGRRAIEYFTTARPDEPLLPITPQIAQLLDIEVYLQDGMDVSPPSDRPSPQQITRQTTDYLGLAGRCSEILGVEASVWEAKGREILGAGHQAFGGEVFAPLIAEYTEVTKRQIADLGTVRWCLSAEARLRADGLVTSISGPSFDCGLAETATEQAICASADLWAADRAMANVYFHYRASAKDQQAVDFLNSQRDWLKRRNQCGSDAACLIERYSSRLFDFGY